MPKGTLRGSPPIPDEDLTTLRIPVYLVANKKLSDDVVGSLTKAVMETRRDLLGQFPMLAQLGAPDTDKDAYIPVHPGAAAYYDGTQQGFFEKYDSALYYGPMALGAMVSLLAGLWKFLGVGAGAVKARARWSRCMPWRRASAKPTATKSWPRWRRTSTASSGRNWRNMPRERCSPATRRR